ncbi:Zim17-type zinc finger protein [Actinidia rufa]|uniref:Zim17-type zinc finger protein n=1 Tax=Actinidia rufa TaxID=165716 RepID=A0A7J0GVE0_9ERIC|nr:Zim17-type zinc finger protein [Actinidia rufa]
MTKFFEYLTTNLEPSWQFLPSASSFFIRDELCKRRIQTLPEQSDHTIIEDKRPEASRLRPDSDQSKALSNPTGNDNSAVQFNATSNLKVSSRHDLAMVFTCKVCETRSIKTMCRESYEKGVVVARCGGCNNLHLIADHLGWFGEPGSVEDLLSARGEEVRKGSVDTLNLTLEDLTGKEIGKMDG